MTQHNKQRHAAAMLVHQLGSGIEALNELSPDIAFENMRELTEIFFRFDQFMAAIATHARHQRFQQLQSKSRASVETQ